MYNLDAKKKCRPPSTDPFHVSQLHVILNRTDKLLADFAAGLQNGEFNPDQPK